MRQSHLLIFLAALAASSASAQDGRGAPSLEGDGRIALQAGWRYAANSTLYDSYYSRPENAGLERAPRSYGGPLVAGSFAYAVTDLMEVGIDLFATAERLQLTGQPRLTTASYGALLGLRLQGWLDLGPEGTVPFVGLLSGPLVASVAFEGQPVRDSVVQAWAGTVGATLRLSPRWGLNVEYRLVFARGATGRADLGSFNAGGNWLTVGVTYFFPKEPGRPLDPGF